MGCSASGWVVLYWAPTLGVEGGIWCKYPPPPPLPPKKVPPPRCWSLCTVAPPPGKIFTAAKKYFRRLRRRKEKISNFLLHFPEKYLFSGTFSAKTREKGCFFLRRQRRRENFSRALCQPPPRAFGLTPPQARQKQPPPQAASRYPPPPGVGPGAHLCLPCSWTDTAQASVQPF